MKHGLLAQSLTKLDDADGFPAVLQRLTDEYQPVGIVEEFLLEHVALTMIRLCRSTRLDAEFINRCGTVIDCPGEPGENPNPEDGTSLQLFAPDQFGAQLLLFRRYETELEKTLFRDLELLAGLQKRRAGRRRANTKSSKEHGAATSDGTGSSGPIR